MYVDYINVQLLPASFIDFVLLNSTFVPASNCSYKLTNSCVNMLAAIVHLLLYCYVVQKNVRTRQI